MRIEIGSTRVSMRWHLQVKALTTWIPRTRVLQCRLTPILTDPAVLAPGQVIGALSTLSVRALPLSCVLLDLPRGSSVRTTAPILGSRSYLP